MSSKFLHVLWCDLQVYKNVKDEECDMCHTVITEILNVLKDKINQVILRNCCVHFRLKLVGWRSVICVKRSCQRSGTWTATVLTRYIQQLLGYHEVLVWDIKSHALCFSLLYRLLNLLFNASNFFFPGKNQSLHQDRVVWKTWFISKLAWQKLWLHFNTSCTVSIHTLHLVVPENLSQLFVNIKGYRLG